MNDNTTKLQKGGTGNDIYCLTVEMVGIRSMTMIVPVVFTAISTEATIRSLSVLESVRQILPSIKTVHPCYSRMEIMMLLI